MSSSHAHGLQSGALPSGLPEVAVRITGLSKTFTGTRALADVNLAIERGSVTALLGGNGSGKSTLIKILAGVYRSDPGGEIEVSGRRISSDQTTPTIARDLGLRFVHQVPGVFRDLTVAENIALANGWPQQAGRVRWSALRRRTSELMERFGLDVDPDQQMGRLRLADQTMVAIARALEDSADGLAVLVLDEPTASLPPEEVSLLLEAVRACAVAEQTIIYVSHRIDEVLSVADAVTVLRDGEVVMAEEASRISESHLIRAIAGRELPVPATAPQRQREQTEPMLAVEDLSAAELHDVTFSVRPGEVVGLAGLLGSGRTELLQAIFGAHAARSTRVEVDGTPLQGGSIAAAMRAGVAYVPEDRGADAAFPDLSVRENLSMAHLTRYRRAVGYAHGTERSDARADISRFGIRSAGDTALLSSLSGGNQQKVILARWLRRRPKVLLLDEPTQGVDVGARVDVWAAIGDAVQSGVAVVVASSDFEELATVADRVLVLRDGRVVTELTGEGLDPHRVTQAVYGSLA